jgi:sec-independent protein translocase protein TatC
MFYAVAVSTIIFMVFPISVDLGSLFSSNPTYVTLSMFVIRKVQEDFLPAAVELLPIDWFAPMEVYFYISILLGVIVSLPIIAYEFYKFINPALYERERNYLFPFVVSFTALFIFGFILGYVFVIPLTMQMLLLFVGPLGLTPSYEFAGFFSLVGGVLFLIGILFTFPVFFILLVKAGILSTEYVTKNRKYLYPGLIIGIALVDPDPTLVTEIVVGLPLIALMELSVIIARRFEKQTVS